MHRHLTTVHKATEGISAFVLCPGVMKILMRGVPGLEEFL